MDIAPVTYSITDGTNWQDTHQVGQEGGKKGGREGGTATDNLIECMLIIPPSLSPSLPPSLPPKVITLLSSLPLSTLTDKSQVDAMLRERGLADASMRAFALTNLLQGDAGMQWQINLEGIKR